MRVINKICKRYDIDVVHGQSPSSFGYALARKRLPLVVTLHGTSYGEIISYFGIPLSSISFASIRDAILTQPLWAFLTSLEYRFADKVIAVSEAIASEASRFYHLPKDKIAVIYNGVNPSYSPDGNAREVENENQMILFVGRLIWRKGAKFIIDAMPQILAEYPDAKLFLVGHGEQEKILKKHVNELRIENSVFFLGKISDEELFHLYQETNVYVQPSLYEPLGIAIMEAMSMGKPVVASRTGGIQELIKGGEEGILVEPGNSLQLGKAILDVFSDSSFGKKMGDNARRRALRDFAWKAIAQKTLKLYENVLQMY
jgi:glycosyltransferase involved in cell wall biosynthesis